MVEQQASSKISNFPFWFSQNQKTNSILRKGFEIENSLAVMSPLNGHYKGPHKRSFWFQHLCFKLLFNHETSFIVACINISDFDKYFNVIFSHRFWFVIHRFLISSSQAPERRRRSLRAYRVLLPLPLKRDSKPHSRGKTNCREARESLSRSHWLKLIRRIHFSCIWSNNVGNFFY